jgi:hypothetical protein
MAYIVYRAKSRDYITESDPVYGVCDTKEQAAKICDEQNTGGADYFYFIEAKKF